MHRAGRRLPQVKHHNQVRGHVGHFSPPRGRQRHPHRVSEASPILRISTRTCYLHSYADFSRREASSLQPQRGPVLLQPRPGHRTAGPSRSTKRAVHTPQSAPRLSSLRPAHAASPPGCPGPGEVSEESGIKFLHQDSPALRRLVRPPDCRSGFGATTAMS